MQNEFFKFKCARMMVSQKKGCDVNIYNHNIMNLNVHKFISNYRTNCDICRLDNTYLNSNTISDTIFIILLVFNYICQIVSYKTPFNYNMWRKPYITDTDLSAKERKLSWKTYLINLFDEARLFHLITHYSPVQI